MLSLIFPLERDSIAVTSLGLYIFSVCMYSLARLLQLNCIYKGWVLPAFSQSLSSTQQHLTPVEWISLPTFLGNLVEINHKSQVIELGRQTCRQHFYRSPISLQNQANPPNFFSFWACKKKTELSSRCVQLKAWLGIRVCIKSGLIYNGLKSYNADPINVLSRHHDSPLLIWNFPDYEIRAI